MADTVVIDVDEFSPDVNGSTKKKKSLKRKRTPSPVLESLSTEDREARIGALREELDGLFKYYKEVLEHNKVCLDIAQCRSSNSVIACLLEESSLPLSKLVDQICEKLKNPVEGSASFTLASIKSSVLLIGQRSFYGVPNADADVLEDDESCLWCWETRDLKLLPKSVRGALKIWRTCRKKIHERICAVSVMITALQKSANNRNCKQELMKALEKIGKVLCEADIRLLVESMLQKNGADMADKELKRESKLLVKELERNQREVEKERKRMDLEHQKEKFQSEKEVKRLQEEAEKKERQREKEESEMRKQLRRQQEEAEKEQRRREKEEAALKKQLALQKQASLMERFLKRSKNNTCASQSSTKLISPDSSSSPHIKENIQGSITFSMDSALSQKDGIKLEEMWKSHLISWHNLGRSNRERHWGIRQKPKTELVKELKLTTSKEMPRDDELNFEKIVDGWDETNIDGRTSSHTKADGSLPSDQKCNHKQLLQFDKSNRPAFYGIWSKKSIVVGPRRPLVKDPDLDYEIDSDEEWEEEEPGESLSDCDKDEESLEEGYLKADNEDESEDSFFVPDGYLSENEGVQVDRMECDDKIVVEASSCKQDVECEEELLAFFRQQKCLHNLTEHALRKNRPLIISNFSQDNKAKAPLLSDKGLTEMCLQALSMRAFPGGGPSIDISVVANGLQDDGQDDSPPLQTKGAGPVPTPTAIQDSDLPQIVSIIQSCSQGLNKVVESLHHQFPAIPKSHLRNKVREISDFLDNHWQVKKDILIKLGLPTTPDKSSSWMKKKSIATFFSKRCLPPSGIKTGNHPNETSPQKPSASSSEAVGTTAEH